MAKKEAVDVALYDRALLEHHEVQPVTTEDGHTITVDTYGKFGAIMGDVTITEPTLEKAREKVHTTHLAQERKRKKKAMAVPCVIFDPGGRFSTHKDATVSLAFFRGIHAGTGVIQYALPDGTKHNGEGIIVWPRGHKDAERVLALNERRHKLSTELDVIHAEMHELKQEQGPKMFSGTVKERGYSHSFDRPRIHNNAALAQEVAEALVANVLTPEEEQEKTP